MLQIIKSEHLKLKRTFSLKILFLMPVITAVVGIILMTGSYVQTSSYNWWYTMLLQATIAIISSGIVQKDSKIGYRAIMGFPIKPEKIWTGKALTGLILLAFTNFIFLVLMAVIGLVFEPDFTITTCILASVIITIAFAWQVPLCMFLTAKIGMFATLLINIVLSFVCIAMLSTKAGLWAVPYAIPGRLMAAVLKIHPNGIPLENIEGAAALGNTNVILPGIVISVVLCIALILITGAAFKNQEAK
ncbi:MAG: lantibiotic immunity ABC transporter MutE/EpiE family permease subunit [Clostridioides sp.]|jgi:ABC-2 type transport system permease protein|nr:lantibiotic immunity ABC transporter MutE/EpiE family permease subunit [Clostridioides sp.]